MFSIESSRLILSRQRAAARRETGRPPCKNSPMAFTSRRLEADTRNENRHHRRRRISRTAAGQAAARAGNAPGRAIRQRPIDRIVLVDVVPPPAFADGRIVTVTGDIADPDLLSRAIDAGTASIFHLAAIVSGMAEADFELGCGSTSTRRGCCSTSAAATAARPVRVHQFGRGLRRDLPRRRDRRPQSIHGPRTGRRKPSASC